MYNVLLDANVMLDYHLARGEHGQVCKELLGALWENEHQMLMTAEGLNNVFYLIAASIKRGARAEKGELTQADAQAALAIAWACARQTLDFVKVVPAGHGECLRALMLRDLHEDFEDNLLVAAGERARVDYLVTSDKRLLAHAPVACLAPEAMLKLLRSEREACG